MNSWPHFEEDEIEAAAQVLRSGRVNYWTGQEVRSFEKEYAAYCQVPHGIAVANATVGLELALFAIGIEAGDEVIVPPRTFIATASSVVLRGAKPVFADVDENSQVVTASSIERAITGRTKAVIVVHLAGWPCEMDAIVALCREHKLRLIEDCAQAHGARYRDRPVGSFGDVGVFSFCQDKIITTAGEGGMLVTADREIWERAWSYKDHGKNYEAAHQPRNGFAAFRWLHDSFGTNWRLTELQAAIGRIQLRKLDRWVEQRRRSASIFNEHFRGIPSVRVTEPPSHIYHSYYKYYAFIRPEHLRPDWSRDRILEVANNHGIRCFSGSCPEIYLEQAFVREGMSPPQRLPIARQLGETSLMLEVHPTTVEADLQRSAAALASIMIEATAAPR
jgi:dTDP-4-amino-4,6-dideoxygalactose transaminase